MAFRPRREARKQKMLKAGFMPFEAQALSKVPPSTPYFRQMVFRRKLLRNRAQREGWNKAEYNRVVKGLYIDNDLLIPTTTRKRAKSKGDADPWAMLRWYKDKYDKMGVPYESPWRKKKIKQRLVREDEVRRRREAKGKVKLPGKVVFDKSLGKYVAELDSEKKGRG